MKKFTDKVHRLSQRAAEIKHMIESVPPKVSEIRDAVTAATGQVQKLRADIISSVSTLRAETDTQLLSALREIDEAADVLAEAGVRLEGVDMDLGATRRLIVQLERIENVDGRRLQALLTANAAHPTLHALLAAVIKADELTDKVEFKYLGFTKLIVEIGLIPSVRIGWRTEMEEPDQVEPAVATAAPAAATLATHAMSAPSTFFERRATPQAEAAPKPAAASAAVFAHGAGDAKPATATTPVPAARASHADKWRASALDRFKKMPELK